MTERGERDNERERAMKERKQSWEQATEKREHALIGQIFTQFVSKNDPYLQTDELAEIHLHI